MAEPRASAIAARARVGYNAGMPVKRETGPASIPPPETVAVQTKTVACDGGGALGHPRVFLNMGGEGKVECPYCDRRFVLTSGPATREKA